MHQMSPPFAAAVMILRDGEWHDGKDVIREAEKAIPPGIAFRRAEKDRAAATMQRYGEVRPRKKPLTQNALVAIGKRAIVRDVVASSVRRKVWEVTPWPVPQGGWRTGGWKVRALNADWIPMTNLAISLGIRTPKLKMLTEQEPAITGTVRGRHTYYSPEEVAEIQRRLDKYNEGTHERRSESAKKVRARLATERRRTNGVCGHCNQPVRDSVPQANELLCHPGDGMDCYQLVTAHHHPMQCKHCMNRGTK